MYGNSGRLTATGGPSTSPGVGSGVGVAETVGEGVGSIGGGWLWRRLLLPVPAYAYAENRS